MKRARIIYNPVSGREVFKYKLSSLVVALSSLDYTVEVYPTKHAKDATDIARKSCEDSIDLLVVSGGDGTLHEVVNGIGPFDKKPTISYIPSGTTNDFAKSIGIPINIDGAIDVLINGVERSMDVGLIEDKYFVYVACFGAFTKVSYSTPSKLKSVFGHLAYVLNGVQDISKLNRPLQIEIESDDNLIKEDASMFFVVNSTGVAGLKNLLPNAKLNDGKFDVVLVNSKNIGIIPEVLKNIAIGVSDDLNKNGLVHFETSNIKISSEKNIKWNLDGEYGLNGDVEIKCLKEHIKIIVPKTTDTLN